MNKRICCVIACMLALTVSAQLRLPAPTGKKMQINVPAKQQQRTTKTKTKNPTSRTSVARNTQPTFNITAPDTVVAGQTFSVSYYLEARSYMHAHVEQHKELRLLETEPRKGSRQSGQTLIPTLTVRAKMTADAPGDYLLPPFYAEVGGKECRSPQPRIHVRPDATYAREYGRATELLSRMLPDTVFQAIRLKLLRRAPEYVLFTDLHGSAFVLVAAHSYWPHLNNPVLAYSTEYGYGIDQPTIAILDYFAERLRRIAALPAGTVLSEPAPDTLATEALLGRTAWGQDEPYNSLCTMHGGARRAVAGCVPVAVAQLMRYHATPVTTDWTAMHDTYSPQDSTVQPVAQLLRDLGFDCHARYGAQVTTASFEHLKSVLVNKYGYSPRLMLHTDLKEAETRAWISAELQAQHPVLASNADHAFVIDGADGSYLHVNFGWAGACNGWYNPLYGTLPDSHTQSSNTFVTTLVTGIMPRVLRNGTKR